MRRRKPLRRTPFKAKKTWKRLSPISKNKKRAAKRFIPKDVLKALVLRSGGVCERVLGTEWDHVSGNLTQAVPIRCTNYAVHVHHILPKGRGGTNELSNLCHLCFQDHAWVHAHPLAAEGEGLLKRWIFDGEFRRS